MSEPKLGMYYSDVAKRIKRITKNPGNPQAKLNLIKSLANQCRLAEGEKSLSELDAEMSANNNRSLAFSGAGNKQTGWGKGYKLGSGKWKWNGPGQWIQVE